MSLKNINLLQSDGLKISFVSMKRLQVLLAALAAVSLTFAAPRSVQQAQQIAGRFVVSSNATPIQRIQRAMNAATPSQPMRLAYTQQQAHSTTPALYVFNAPDHGYVLVSADDRTRAILGYSDTDIFNPDSIPDNLRFWLCMYADEIASLPDETSSQIPAPPAHIATSAQTTYPTIEPLLGDIEWGQNAPFNLLCPSKDNTKCVTGCVATAAAQIMYYHQYPTTGIGSNSYEWNEQTLSADFSATTYDWDNMLPTYKSTDVSEHATAVATLMYHAGIACNMNYGLSAKGGSSANSFKMLQALINNFDYDKGLRVLPKDYMEESDLLTRIARELKAKRPVYMNGYTIKKEGHAFVLDGMQSNGFVHINWGWTGYSNSYFAISALNPYGQGTGGAASGKGFTEGITAYVGIKPNANGDSIPTITADTILYTSADAIAKTEKLTFSLNPFFNKSLLIAKGSIVYMIYKDNAFYKAYKTNKTYNLNPNHYYIKPSTPSGSLSSLEAGEYELVVGVIPDSSHTVYPILTKIAHGPRRFPITVTADSIFVGEGTIDVSAKANTDFTHASIFDLTDYVGFNMLYLNLLTDDYATSEGNLTAGTRCELALVPATRTSIIGTYQLAASTSKGALYSDPSWTALKYAVDDHSTSKALSTGTVTITLDALGNYVFIYDFTAGSHSYTDTLTLPASQVDIQRYMTDTEDFVPSTLRNIRVTALSATETTSLIKTFATKANTSVPYLIEGTISKIASTAALNKKNGYARFYISDDGTTTNQLYCYKTYWLDNQSYQTGSEIQVGDHVVLCTPLQYYSLTTPRATSGYIYQHTSVDSLRDITIRTHIDPMTAFIPSGAGSTSDAIYYYWWESGEDGLLIQAQSEVDNWWTTTITTAADSIACLVVNQDVATKGWTSANYTSDSAFFTADICFQLSKDSDVAAQTSADTAAWILAPIKCEDDAATPLSFSESDALHISVSGHTLTISTLTNLSTSATPIRIYNISGQLIFSSAATDNQSMTSQAVSGYQTITCTLPTSGLYIISTPQQTTKITIP